MSITYAALVASSAFLTLGTVLPFVPRPYWWVRIFDYPRAQLGVAALAVLGGLAAYHVLLAWPVGWQWFVPAALLAVVAYQAARILPYTPLWKKESCAVDVPDDGGSLRVVVSNVKMDSRAVERWARVVTAARPDVVAAVETDAWWTERIGRALADYPHRVEVPQDNTYGMALYARFPLEDARVEHLVEETVPSLFACVVLPSGERVRLVVVHPRPPRPDTAQGSEFRDAELARLARVLGHDPERTLVAGDLNDVAWSATTRRFQALSGLLDPRRGRGLYPTFPVKYAPLRYPLDHVFHSADLGLVALHRLGDVGSDHFPMCIELAPSPVAERKQAPVEADAEDVEDGAEAEADAEATLQEESAAERHERDREDR